MKFAWLRDAIVVPVLPQPQGRRDCISLIDHTVPITTVCWLVVFGKGQESVWSLTGRRIRLWRKATKQFLSIIDYAVTVAVQDEPCIITVSCGP